MRYDWRRKNCRTIHDQSDKYKVQEKLGRYLATKGFDWDTIKESLTRFWRNSIIERTKGILWIDFCLQSYLIQ